MRCLTNFDAAQAREAVFPRERLQERLAALRKAVEGLPSARVGERAGAQAAAAAPCQGPSPPWGADWGLPAELPCGALNEVVAGHADRPAAFGFLFTLMTLGLITVSIGAMRALSCGRDQPCSSRPVAPCRISESLTGTALPSWASMWAG